MKKITRNDLIQYKEMKRNLQCEIDDHNRLYNTYRSPSFSSDGSGFNMNPSSPVERAFDQIQKSDEKIQKIKSDLQEIRDHVDNISDYRMRTILQYKYIIGYTWKETASKMFLSESIIRQNEQQFWNEHEFI